MSLDGCLELLSAICRKKNLELDLKELFQKRSIPLLGLAKYVI